MATWAASGSRTIYWPLSNLKFIGDGRTFMPVFSADIPIETRWGKSTCSDYRSAHQLLIQPSLFAGGGFFRLEAVRRCLPPIPCNCKGLLTDGELRWRIRVSLSRKGCFEIDRRGSVVT